MGTQRWYCCVKCHKVGTYIINDDGTTTLPEGEWPQHKKFMVTDLKTRQEARDGLILYAHLFKKALKSLRQETIYNNRRIT